MLKWNKLVGRGGILIASVWAFGVCAADAQVYKYTYKSANYTTNVEGCITSLMHLSIQLNLPAPIPPNASVYDVSPISWTVSDGLHGFNSATPGAILYGAVFWTDNRGKITDWFIEAFTSGQQEIVWSSGAPTAPEDYGLENPCKNGKLGDGESFIPKTWKQPKK
jgi:hypothetical protein